MRSTPTVAMQNVAMEMLATTILRYALACALIAAVYRETLGWETIAYIGPFNFTVIEPTFLFASAAAVAMWIAFRKDFSIETCLLLILSAILLLNVLRGLSIGPAAAITSLRSTGAFYALLLATIPFGKQCNYSQVLTTYLFRAAAVLSIVIFTRVGIAPNFLRMVAPEEEGRAMAAQGALIIAIAAVAALSYAIRQRFPLNQTIGAFCVFAIAVVATRQGTATICLLVGCAIVFALERGIFLFERRLLVFVGALLGGGAYVLFAGLLTIDTVSGLLPSSLLATLEARSATLDTRGMIWDGVGNAYDQLGAFSQLFGVPAGVRPTVMIEHPSWGYVQWEVGYHSMYYVVMMFFGVIGLYSLIAMFGIGAFNALRRPVTEVFPTYPSSAFSLGVVTMCALFSYSYDLKGEAALFLSLALIQFPSVKLPKILFKRGKSKRLFH